jgi:hypothetical protein
LAFEFVLIGFQFIEDLARDHLFGRLPVLDIGAFREKWADRGMLID